MTVVETAQQVLTEVHPQGAAPVVADAPQEGIAPQKTASKKPRLTESEQRQILTDILLPLSKLKGKIVLVSLPTGTHGLKPSKNEVDAVKEWAYDQFHQTHGKAPTLQAYKAACASIGVTLREHAMKELAACNPGAEDGHEGVSLSRSTSNDSSDFLSAERIDGHDSLYIFTLHNGDHTIGRLKITTDKKTDEEYETMTVLWGPNVFPVVHEVLEVEDANEGMQTQYDVTIASKRRTLPLETFKTGNWIDFFPGITGVLDSSKEKLYKAALMQVASKAPRVAAFLTTGLKKLNTTHGSIEWVYVFPDGRYQARKGADLSTFKVRLVQEILSPEEKRVWQGYQFPTELSSQERQQAAYNYIRDITPNGVGLLNFSHEIGATLYELRNANFGPAHVLVLEAPPGEGKTTLAGLNRSQVYPFQGQKPTPDASFQDTVTSIEDDLTYRGSMPVIVDDFVMEGASETKKAEMAVSLDAFSRAVFNVKPVRKRMRSSRTGLRKQRANYIRTLPVATVEGLPKMPTSFYRRVLIAKLNRGDVVKKSDGRTDVVALDQMGKHAPVLQSWGHLGIIHFFLERLATEGFDTVVKKLEVLYRQAFKDIREAVISKWEQCQRGNTLPSDWDGIADSAAYELLYFRLARMTIFKGLETSDSDLFPHLVEMVYQQMLRMANMVPDEEGLLLFEKGVIQLFESIAQGKVTNNQRWRVDKNVPRTGNEEPPLVFTHPDIDGNLTEDSYTFPRQFWGWIEVAASEHPPRYQTVAYIDDNTIYLTGDARAELLRIVSKMPTGENIVSDKALGDLAEREGWILKTQRGDLNRRTVKITPPQGPTRVWAVSLAKFLAHYEDIKGDSKVSGAERPPNVSGFPGKPEPDPFADVEEVSGDF